MDSTVTQTDNAADLDAASWRLFDGIVGLSIMSMLDYVGSAVYQQLLADLDTAKTALDASRGLERIKLSAKVVALAERLRRRQALQPVVLQNRDRSTAASIAQVQSIAKNPDPDLLGFNKTATEGAPIVFADYDEVSIPASLLGRKTTVTFTKDMSKVPVQYAVVPAADVMVSHDFNGQPVQGYDDMEAPGRLRAVAGNGRAAGIMLAYQRGTADGYKAGLLEDADLLQLDPLALAAVEQPMLVRVMRHEDVTSDIGDKTNSSGTAGLSAVEQAKTDADRVSFEGLTFNEDGTPTVETLTAFVRAMPVAEQATLAPDGTPTNQALDRLMAATFNRAYQNDDLVKLYSQSLDPEIKNVLFGMAQAAGDMAALAGKGEYDVRAFVTDAASLASNAKRAGLPLSRMAEQRDMSMAEEANDIAAMFARNVRSAKKIGDALRSLARAALETADAEAEDMFGPVEKRKPADLVAEAMAGARSGSLLDATPLPQSWLGFKVVDQAFVEAESATVLPSANNIAGDVVVSLDDGALMVAGKVVAVTFTADKVSYSIALRIAQQVREDVQLWAVIHDIDSVYVTAPVEGVKLLDSLDDSALNALTATAPMLDAATDALARMRDAAALAAAVKTLKAGGGSPIERLKLSGEVRRLVLALGGSVADPIAPVGVDESDDPNSPNYRYADTGYIADSRKEKAANQIRLAKESGQLVQATSIDWVAVEKNPRAAAELIVKSNLFGQVDWEALGAAGMEPAAGFLIDRVYASIAPVPEDSPQVRKDYALALSTIRSRLEVVTTVKGVRDVLEEILGEMQGTNLNESETERYSALTERILALKLQINALQDSTKSIQDEANETRKALDDAEWDIRKRERRGWKVEPSHLQAVEAAKVRNASAWGRFTEAINVRKAQEAPLREEGNTLTQECRAIREAARTRNADSALARGWFSFGSKFIAVVKYRYSNTGSSAFASHVVNAENGKIKDWSWATKERVVTRGATKKEVSFQMLVADSFERVGGKPIAVQSTASLKSAFGLREVQSGNWVLKDPNSARFHVERAGAAFSDMADMLGIDAAHLGLGGRIGMAFGARGSGGKNAARAHWEPVHRVVNITKMGGGGALGHELFHAFDNMLPSLARGVAGKKDEFATSNPEHMPAGPLRTAFAELRKAIMTGDERMEQTFDITDSDRRLAKGNVGGYYSNSVGQAIKAAGNVTDAILAVDRLLGDRAATSKKSAKNHKQWRQIAAAYYTPEGEASITAKTGRAASRYLHDAAALDNGEDGKYWSQDVELAARAFQSWLEDSLDAKGRRNDYLSAKADNKHYAFSGAKPFPEGEERTRINAAFDKLFHALRESKVFESAAANPQLLDSIFGPVEVSAGAAAALLGDESPLEASRRTWAALEQMRASAESLRSAREKLFTAEGA